MVKHEARTWNSPQNRSPQACHVLIDLGRDTGRAERDVAISYSGQRRRRPPGSPGVATQEYADARQPLREEFFRSGRIDDRIGDAEVDIPCSSGAWIESESELHRRRSGSKDRQARPAVGVAVALHQNVDLPLTHASGKIRVAHAPRVDLFVEGPPAGNVERSAVAEAKDLKTPPVMPPENRPEVVRVLTEQ